MLGGVREVDSFRACCHDGATRIARRCDKRCFVHQPQRVPAKQRAIVIRLVREDHLDHGDDLRRAMNHEPRTFRPLRIWTGKKAAQRKRCDHPAFPSEACAYMLTIEQASRQVFGLAGYLLAPASQFMAEPVLMSERSFLLTAAGQFRILTGFPFKPDLAIGHREVV
jgi:hypothetical protein